MKKQKSKKIIQKDIQSFRKMGTFTVIPGTEADVVTPEPTVCIIDTLLPMGFKTILAGTTGSNKSYYAMQEGMSIANDEDTFLGFKINKKGLKVLYVDTESGPVEMHRRYLRLQKTFENWKGSARFTMLSKEGSFQNIWNALMDAIESFQPDMLYIDCLYNTTTDRDLTKSINVSKFTDRITEIRERYDLTIRIIHHFNKGQHDLGLTMDRMSGANALQNWVEHLMLLSYTCVSSLRLITIVKARGIDYPREYYGLDWDSEQFKLSMIGIVSDWKKYLLDENKIDKWQMALGQMAETFETKDWLNKVVHELGIVKERQAKRWLKEMSIAKIIEDCGHGNWRKTDMKFVDEILDNDIVLL